ncbi:c-type cytochrome [Solimonas marina]|uniref:Cytochrome c n=1 Tax=Solimonas marina TaxID=2714601 RepID=A0A969W5V6_9GAMM|nr:cytochrome c [Solimonas marina]NKF21221.1 cytochrome c [Solimonas marina]
MKPRHLIVPFAVASVFAIAACHQKPQVDPAIEAAIKTRHDGFKQIGGAMKKIGDTLKSGGSLNPELTEAAHTMNQEAVKIKDWFPAGSGPESGLKTGAKPEIWEKPDEFAQKRDALVTEVGKLTAAADAGDAAGFAEQVPAVGQACKSCHEEFRNKDEH